jgi:KDO2-lipid IV(A) lauroyltransferase
MSADPKQHAAEPALGKKQASSPPGARAAPNPAHVPLYRFWHPRFWRAWLFYLWLRLTASLPLRAALALYRGIGRVLYRTASRQRRVVRRNLDLCFPELSEDAREQLVLRHFESFGMSIAETAYSWFASDRRLAPRFTVHGLEHLKSALERGKGVILYTGHFATIDICGHPLKHATPLFAVMFSRRSNELLEEVQRRGRMREAHEAFPSDNVRAMIRSLQRNAAVWYAPDHTYLEGELLPFFGELAMTNVATSKLARLTGAVVLPFAYRRSDPKGRYELTLHPPLDDFPTDDPVADTRRLVRYLEEFIRQAPEQYQWMHRRFKDRPAPLPDLYAKNLRDPPAP